MKKYVAYIRVSTQKQGQTGVSLQEQRAAIERYAEINRLQIETWYEERETAAKRGRPIFTQMLEQVERSSISGIILHKIDRGARNLRDWADLGGLVDKGIEVHSANESLDLHSRGGRLSADIQAVVAADYIRNLREETLKGFYGRLRQGLYPLAAPYGYLDQGRGKAKIPDPKTAPFIRHAFELYASGRYTLRALREELHKLGLRNRGGKKISLDWLSRTLNNPFYAGIIKLKTTDETFRGIHEPLVTKDLYDRVQDILNGRKNIKTFRHDFLYRCLLTCGDCGYSLIGERQKGHIYYRCHERACPTKSIRQELVDVQIGRVLKRVQLSPEEMDQVVKHFDAFDHHWEERQTTMIAAAELRLSNMTERMDRLTDALIDGLISKDTFERRRASILENQVATEQSLASLRAGDRSILERLEKFLELLKTAQRSYLAGNADHKRILLQEVTSNRLVSGKNVAVELFPPFDLIANREKSDWCCLSRNKPRTFSKKTSVLGKQLINIVVPDLKAEEAAYTERLRKMLTDMEE
ncbi:MAG: resolvase [Parvibaculum sp.]|jgi:DNA invertase Pin-like site-specific DNA recombinase|uniref:recombinase family protein n=2 Tax=Parvibaculum sp. TaxID=2024848 RepID=UPI000C461281|nr:recombinase family protein [Parvibaculum sp.]MAU61717.1 resolvase [Parvibaculum sp.]|tara:strand:+ start:3662 stop:5242 length:1581 start_codon:yes stop_codon:yes gene_type:complete